MASSKKQSAQSASIHGGLTPQQTVRVVARPGWLSSFFTMILAIVLLGGVGVVGVFFGIVGTLASQSLDQHVFPTTFRDGDASRKVAMIPIERVIDADASTFVRHAVDHVLADDAYKAVVLRVDSPGGAVTPSDQIWHQVGRLQRQGIPVVASFGGVAASGGYYIAAGADHIVAETTSITGSIGVIAQILTLQELMGKVGVEPVTLVASGSPQKDVANNIFRDWTEADKERVRMMLNDAYQTFVDRVASGRSNVINSDEMLTKVTDGSIFTAEQALVNGLVDAIGYVDDAIVEAEKAGKISTGAAQVIQLDAPYRLFDGLMARERTEGVRLDSLDADAIRSFVNDLSSPRLLYLMH